MMMANDQMMAQMSKKGGFIAALDQSGGSWPGALRLCGIPDTAYDGEAEMFRLIHQMRVRIMTAAAFSGDKVIGTILFEGTLDGEGRGKQTAAQSVVGRAARRPRLISGKIGRSCRSSKAAAGLNRKKTVSS